MSGEADEGMRFAAACPQIRDAIRDERFATKSERRKACGKQRLAPGVVRCDRAAGDQFARERKRGLGRHVHAAMLASAYRS